MKEILNAEEAAKVLGIDGAVVRFNLQKGIWTFGQIVKEGQKKRRYIIYAREMCKQFGIPVTVVERMSDEGAFRRRQQRRWGSDRQQDTNRLEDT